jgi:arginine decarboxylase
MTQTAPTPRHMRAEFGSGIPPRAYSSVWRLRADAWATVADVTRRLSVGSIPDDQLHALRTEVAETLQLLDVLETYWAYPGHAGLGDLVRLWDAGEYEHAMRLADTVIRHISGQEREVPDAVDRDVAERPGQATLPRVDAAGRPIFQVLVVDGMAEPEAEFLKQEMRRLRRPEDPFTYELVVVTNFNDAVLAVLFNSEIQACVLRPGFAASSPRTADQLRHFPSTDHLHVERLSTGAAAVLLGERIAELRPELDLYLVANRSIERIAVTLTRRFRRIFGAQDALELHLSILRGVQDRHETPFFTALRGYSRQPTGVFHALPISRGKSVVNSPWIRDMSDFYGLNIFLAETSATSGGLDSLLEPSGPIKRAQELAARAFGARQTFFVTNGTSTANKIVVQSIVAPGDVVLVDRNCHKSHHYALMLAGARVTYLDSYPIEHFSMYGAVPLAHIKQQLLNYQAAGRLHEVKLLSLTNCTFDGIVYDVERVMHECLAIKPDLVFLWDEAWFAFAGFHPIYRRRTAMAAARTLHERYRSAEYARQYAEASGSAPTMPDPERVRIRVYATQSTHKTLTALRQGSMIHVYDQDFETLNEAAFHEAYMTHTSTSPNYFAAKNAWVPVRARRGRIR